LALFAEFSRRDLDPARDEKISFQKSTPKINELFFPISYKIGCMKTNSLISLKVK